MSVEQAKRTKFEALGDFSFVQLLGMIACKKYSADNIADAANWYRSTGGENNDTGAIFKALVLESLWFIMLELDESGGANNNLQSTVFRELPKYIK